MNFWWMGYGKGMILLLVFFMECYFQTIQQFIGGYKLHLRAGPFFFWFVILYFLLFVFVYVHRAYCFCLKEGNIKASIFGGGPFLFT